MSDDQRGSIELRLPSQLRFLGVVDAVVQSFSSEFGLAQDDINNLSTATIEAAANAMEHANKFDASKSVLLRLQGQGAAIDVTIEDEGQGFDPRPYERELTAEDLLKLRGRGIFIMRSFMDEVRFARTSRGSMRVHLRKVGRPSQDDSGRKDAARGN
ncbi:MAG TPA: ATP-binding protein [Candidatus Krumholzibacteria bacterium]|jgi:serine/threonine-protein kinase RsbW|nr:ATP-binding protein [Candidatus Krumholzibacteria bacterium]